MNPASERKIVLVVRKTRLDNLITRYNTADQARFVVESQGGDFEDYQREHQTYYASLQETESVIAQNGRIQILERSYLPNFIFGKNDLVLAIGQDGLVANTLKYLNGQPLIGINPDPKRWDGILLPFKGEDLAKILPEALAETRPSKNVTMAQATLYDGQKIFGVNDLFIGPKTHFSARYRIELGSVSENHSSSGIIVSTGLGSTGWLSSLLTGAVGITSSLDDQPQRPHSKSSFPWDADRLQYTVREPFPSTTTQTNLVFGQVDKQQQMRLTSHMPENGVIFSDGIETDYLNFNSGTEALIAIADKKGILVL